MTTFKALMAATAVLAASSVASAEQLAERVDRPIQTVSSVMQSVESRSDYGRYMAVHYDRGNRAYAVLYATKDGAPKLVVIDAVTGKETR